MSDSVESSKELKDTLHEIVRNCTDDTLYRDVTKDIFCPNCKMIAQERFFITHTISCPFCGFSYEEDDYFRASKGRESDEEYKRQYEAEMKASRHIDMPFPIETMEIPHGVIYTSLGRPTREDAIRYLVRKEGSVYDNVPFEYLGIGESKFVDGVVNITLHRCRNDIRNLIVKNYNLCVIDGQLWAVSREAMDEDKDYIESFDSLSKTTFFPDEEIKWAYRFAMPYFERAGITNVIDQKYCVHAMISPGTRLLNALDDVMPENLPQAFYEFKRRVERVYDFRSLYSRYYLRSVFPSETIEDRMRNPFYTKQKISITLVETEGPYGFIESKETYTDSIPEECLEEQALLDEEERRKKEAIAKAPLFDPASLFSESGTSVFPPVKPYVPPQPRMY